MDTSFTEMRLKQVINVADGSLLGHIVDVIFDTRSSRILGFVVPGARQSFFSFKPCPEIFIPYHNICKIGEDVILVEVFNLPVHHRNPKIFANNAKNMSTGYQNPQDYLSATQSAGANGTQVSPQNASQTTSGNANPSQNSQNYNTQNGAYENQKNAHGSMQNNSYNFQNAAYRESENYDVRPLNNY